MSPPTAKTTAPIPTSMAAVFALPSSSCTSSFVSVAPSTINSRTSRTMSLTRPPIGGSLCGSKACRGVYISISQAPRQQIADADADQQRRQWIFPDQVGRVFRQVGVVFILQIRPRGIHGVANARRRLRTELLRPGGNVGESAAGL